MDRLVDRDLAILQNLERFRLLSTEHIRRLHFVDHKSDLAAARATTRTMNRLADLNLVGSLARRVGGARRGSASYIWHLAAAGERLLRAVRGEAGRRRFMEPGATFVAHTLAVNDVAVALLEAGQAGAGLTIEALTTEPKNWRPFIGPGGEARWLKPDLHVISVRSDSGNHEDEFEEHHFVEMDLGTEHIPRIQAKCRIYAAYAATGAYQAEHGLFPAVVWISADAARRAALQRAVADVPGMPPGTFSVASPEGYRASLGGQI